jgi:hypothetical protein
VPTKSKGVHLTYTPQQPARVAEVFAES